MNREEIMQILPHRDDMLLIETAEMGEDGVATATYTVRGDEFFLRGHFPGNPVVPGVILCEIIAQGACTLFGEEMKGKTPLYTGIDKVRFRRMVKPGDTILVLGDVERGLAILPKAMMHRYISMIFGELNGEEQEAAHE